MAVRNANCYLLDSHHAVLGLSITGKLLHCDYPLDQYRSDVRVADGALVYRDVLADAISTVPVEKRYSDNGRSRMFRGKRAFECRVGRWSCLGVETREALYSTLKCEANPRDMGLLLPHLSLRRVHGDSKATLRLLAALSQVSYDSLAKSAVTTACTVASAAAQVTAPAAMSTQEAVFDHLGVLAKCSVEIAQLVSMERGLKRLVGLCARMSRVSRYPGLKTRLAKSIASKLWFESEDEDNVTDAYLSIAMNSSVKEELDDLDDRMDELEDAGKYGQAELIELAKIKVKAVASELAEIGSRIVCVGIGDCRSVYATKDGVMLVDGDVAHVASKKDIGLAIELVQEAISAAVDLGSSAGASECAAYYRALKSLWKAGANLSDDEANYLSCAHRDFELDVKQVDIRAFRRDGKYVTVEDCVAAVRLSSVPCASVLDSYMRARPRTVSAYHWARLARCVPLCRFSVPLLASEAKRVYDITHQPDAAALSKLKLAIKLQLGLCYKSRHGTSPKGFDEALIDLDEFSSLDDKVVAMADWDMRGVASFDATASIARDKSNIPYSEDILTGAKTFNGASVMLRREILYFTEHDKDRECRAAVAYFKGGCSSRVKVHVGVKPESKEGGRAVTSERSDIRKANSAVTNNLLPYVDQIGGSLLAASPGKRERAVHDMVLSTHDAEGYVGFFLATDFVKFGHSLSYSLQKAVFEVVSEFFDQEWISNIPDMLQQQDICCVYGDHFASFENPTGGDGQGMRNAVWQLMLAGCLVFVNTELAGQVDNLRGEKPLDLLYFMDDHLFHLAVKHEGRVGGKSGLDPILAKKLRAVEDAICVAYNRVGLGTNEEKNTRSLDGAILTGMQISKRGRESVPGRAIQRAYVETSHRAPSLVDVVANVAASCSSAMEDGRDRLSTLAASLMMSSLKVVDVLPSACKRSPKLVAVALVTPVAMGGLGHPLESNWVINSGTNLFDDVLYCLFKHLTNKTVMTAHVSRFVKTLSQSRKLELHSCGSTFTVKHNRVLEAPSTVIHRFLRKSKLAAVYSRLDGLKKHKETCIKYLSSCYSVLPGTVVQALVLCHPHSVLQADVERVTSSATATMLLGETDLGKARRATTYRSMQYLSAVSRLASSCGAGAKNLEWQDFVWEFGQACKDVSVETPPRGPRFSLVLASDGPVADLCAHELAGGAVYGILEPSKSATTASRGAELWTSTERAAVNTAVDVLLMCNSTVGSEGVKRVLDAIYGVEALQELLVVDEVPDPFRSIQSVQFAPQTSGYGVRKELQKQYVTVESMIEVRKTVDDGRRGHVNHAAAMAAALCAANMCRNFTISELAAWVEPVFLVKGTKQMRPLRSAVGPPLVAQMIKALSGSCVSSAVDLFSDFQSDSLQIMKYMETSAKLYSKYKSMRSQLPSTPASTMTSYLSPVASAVAATEKPKQSDAVLRILAIRVVGRAASSAFSDKCMALIASAQKQLLNYTGDDTQMAEARATLEPTAAECSEAFEICKRANILQPMMHTLDRYYRAAKHAQLQQVDKASPKAFVLFAKSAYKAWHRLLHSSMGELCHMDVPYSESTLYPNVARYWSARHKRHYAHAAYLARTAKDQGDGVPPPILAELLSYEAKAKALAVLATQSQGSAPAAEALQAVARSCYEVFARSCAKHTNKAHQTVAEMHRSLRRSGKVGLAEAWALSADKVSKMFTMIYKDLSTLMPPGGNRATLDSVSVLVGVHEAAGLDRNWAEGQDATTSSWLKDFAVKSAFGTSLEPIVDYAYLARSELTMASPFSESSSTLFRLKRRSKLSYTQVDGNTTVSHPRASYGSEAGAGRRHGRDLLADPSDSCISPLTVPSDLANDLDAPTPEAATPPAIAPREDETTPVAAAPVARSGGKTLRGKISRSKKLVDVPEWQD